MYPDTYISRLLSNTWYLVQIVCSFAFPVIPLNALLIPLFLFIGCLLGTVTACCVVRCPHTQERQEFCNPACLLSRDSIARCTVRTWSIRPPFCPNHAQSSLASVLLPPFSSCPTILSSQSMEIPFLSCKAFRGGRGRGLLRYRLCMVLTFLRGAQVRLVGCVETAPILQLVVCTSVGHQCVLLQLITEHIYIYM